MPRPLKILAILLAVPLVMAALALGYAATKPSAWRVEVSGFVAAPPAAVQAVVERPRSWLEWSPWNQERDASLESSFEGPEGGKGAVWVWSGTELGQGRLVIAESEAGRKVAYQLLIEGASAPLEGTLTFTPSSEGKTTTVTWVGTGDFGSGPLSLLGRLMEPIIRDSLTLDFQAGIVGLDELARAGRLRTAGTVVTREGK